MQSHYAACWLSLMLFVSGLFFQKLYTEDCRRPLLQRLFAAGIRPREYLCGKILFPAAFRLLLFAALLSLLGRVVPLQISAASLLLLLAAIAAAAVMVACTAVLLAGKGSWQGLILGVSALGLLLVGGLLPRGMLPAGLTLVGDFLPLGAIRAMLLPLFGGQLLWKPAVAAVVYAAVLLVLCLRALRCPTEKGGAV